MACDHFYDPGDLTRIQTEAFVYYREKGYSNLEAYDCATEAVEWETGCRKSRRQVRAVREEARRADYAEGVFVRSMLCGYTHRAFSRRYEYDEPEPRRRAKHSSSHPSPKTEYYHMFQYGGDKYASRTSGKVLDPEEIEVLAEKMYYDIREQGKNSEYARQKSEQFYIRELGKYNKMMMAAGYVMGGDNEYEEDDRCTAAQDERRGTRRAWPARKEFDDEPPDYGCQDEGACDTSRPYSEEDLKLIREKIYEEWCNKGENPREAKREAQKWYNAKMKARGGGSPSRRSGFDRFGGMRGALNDDDDHSRNSQSSHGSRPSKSNSSQRYRAEERQSGGGSRGYRTEERWPGGRSRGYRAEERRSGGGCFSNSYNDSEELGGVKPDVDLYKLLGISKYATEDEIKKIHRKLCLRYHPDRVVGDSAAKKAATDKMANINQACDVLKDLKMRAYYDRTGLIARMS